MLSTADSVYCYLLLIAIIAMYCWKHILLCTADIIYCYLLLIAFIAVSSKHRWIDLLIALLLCTAHSIYCYLLLIAYMWPSATKWGFWGECQNWEKYFIAINSIFYTFWCKIDYSTTILSNVTVCWTLQYIVSFKITSQRVWLSKIVICVYLYVPIKKNIFHNTSLLSHFH